MTFSNLKFKKTDMALDASLSRKKNSYYFGHTDCFHHIVPCEGFWDRYFGDVGTFKITIIPKEYTYMVPRCTQLQTIGMSVDHTHSNIVPKHIMITSIIIITLIKLFFSLYFLLW